MSKRGWIGVDLDGTLAVHKGYKGPAHIGAPVSAMVDRVKAWRAAGRDVRIFTARVYVPPLGQVKSEEWAKRSAEATDARAAIRRWCMRYLGEPLPITNVKDFDMEVLYDDRAVQVERNTGVLIG